MVRCSLELPVAKLLLLCARGSCCIPFEFVLGLVEGLELSLRLFEVVQADTVPSSGGFRGTEKGIGCV